MEREQDSAGTIELGTASVDTHGRSIFGAPEEQGFYTVGISDD